MLESDVATVRAGDELDWSALEHWLREAIDGLEGSFSVLQFPRGSANLTYRVTIGDTHLVVRRPPFGGLATGSHDMGREFRVLSRLHRAYDRAPRALAHCLDRDVIGAEFFVAEYRTGIVVWDRVPDELSSDPDASTRVGALKLSDDEAACMETLRRFRHAEALRLVFRDVNDLDELPETLSATSVL